MPKLAYTPKKKPTTAPGLVGVEETPKEVSPELEIAGKSIQLAGLDQLAAIGTELDCTIKIVLEDARIEEKVDWETADRWDNRLRFKVKELYVTAVKDAPKPESEQAKFEKGVIGIEVSNKKTSMSAKDALGNYAS